MLKMILSRHNQISSSSWGRLTTLLFDSISHKKLMARRRKINLKKMPFSETKLKQIKNQRGNVQKLQKEAEIRQRLEHRPQINRNINELIEEMYFPDLAAQNEVTATQAYKIQYTQAQAEKERLIEYRLELERIFSESNLNSELLAAYESHRQQFLGDLEDGGKELLLKMVSRMDYCSRCLPRIKEQRLKSWGAYEQKMKNRGIQLQCPLKFYDAKDVERHDTWALFIGDCVQRVQRQPLSSQAIKRELELHSAISRFIGGVPQSYYLALFHNIKEQYPDPAQIPNRLKGPILKMLSELKHLRLDGKISVQLINKETENVKDYACNLVDSLYTHPQALDFNTIVVLINFVRRERPEFINLQTLHNIQPLLLQPVLQFGRFQFVADTFLVYYRHGLGTMENLQFLKFDLIRKIEQCQKVKAVLELLKVIKEGKVTLFRTDMVCQHDLIPAMARRILQQLPSNTLSSADINLILRGFYNNGYSDATFYDLLATEFVKKIPELGLEDVMDLFFLLTIQGVKSQSLAVKVLDYCIKNYAELMKKYKGERVSLLPLSKITSANYEPANSPPSQSQMVLEDRTVLAIWCYLQQIKQNLDIDKLFRIYPISSKSSHPLIHELAEAIYSRVKQYRILPKIRMENKLTSLNQKHLDWAYSPATLSQATSLMLRQAELSGRFFRNLEERQDTSKRAIIRLKWTYKFLQDSNSSIVIDQRDYESWLLKNHTKEDFQNSLFFRIPSEDLREVDKESMDRLVRDRLEYSKRLLRNSGVKKGKEQPQNPKAAATSETEQQQFLSDGEGERA